MLLASIFKRQNQIHSIDKNTQIQYNELTTSRTLSLCSLFGGRAEQQLDVSNAIARPAVYSFMLPVT